jgi:hypothetical protein
MPDSNTSSDPDRVVQTDPTGPLDELVKSFIQNRKGKSQKPVFDAHSPISESVDGNSPETLAEGIAFVSFKILFP